MAVLAAAANIRQDALASPLPRRSLPEYPTAHPGWGRICARDTYLEFRSALGVCVSAALWKEQSVCQFLSDTIWQLSHLYALPVASGTKGG